MLGISNLTFDYGNRTILDNISLEMEGGTFIAILGVNGSGKSTLLKNLNGILRPRTGAVFIDGRDLKNMSGAEVAKYIGYMPQKTNPAACTVFDAVLLGRKPYINWNAKEEDFQIVNGILARLGLADYALRQTNELSGGELQKVVIARALAQEPRVLLLDEPISHLDIKNQMDTLSLLREIATEIELTVVVVIHDLSLALRFADRFILLKKGKLYAVGDQHILTRESIKDVFQIDANIHLIDKIPVVVPC